LEQFRSIRSRGPGLLTPCNERIQPRDEPVGGRRGGGFRVEVKAGTGSAMAGRALRVGLEQQRIAVAVDRQAAQGQAVARSLALAPQALAAATEKGDPSRF